MMGNAGTKTTSSWAGFFSFRGRATGNYVLGAYLILLFLAALIGALAEYGLGWREEVVQSAVMALIIPTFVRRMHDNGRSGWWAIVPVIGLVPRLGNVELPLSEPSDLLVLALAPFFFWGLNLLIQSSDQDPGGYGPDPRIA